MILSTLRESRRSPHDLQYLRLHIFDQSDSLNYIRGKFQLKKDTKPSLVFNRAGSDKQTEVTVLN